MKPKLWINIVSALVASAGAVLAVGDTLVAMPGLPDGLVSAWPLVLVGSTLIQRIGNAVLEALKPTEPK